MQNVGPERASGSSQELDSSDEVLVQDNWDPLTIVVGPSLRLGCERRGNKKFEYFVTRSSISLEVSLLWVGDLPWSVSKICLESL